MKALIRRIDAVIMWLKMWHYFRSHTIEDLQKQLWDSGCSISFSHNSRIYHLKNGGKIIFTGNLVEVIPVERLVLAETPKGAQAT